jgi:hypothetical protein
MPEQRRIPQLEQLESREMLSASGVPYLAPPVYFGASHAIVAPHVIVTSPVAARESQVACDLVTPAPAAECSHPLAAVWQTDIAFSPLAEGGDHVSADWPPLQQLREVPPINGVTASPHQACETANPVAVAAEPSSPQQPPTMAGVHRYASKSINRHRVGDRDDAVQQICLEWLLLAATAVTTYDDVRRIVARVIARGYRRLKKQERVLELLDVPVQADPAVDAFRDMQLDRDLGVKDLTDREWQVIGLRRQGYTFAEIGEKVGMRKQRARELFNLAVSYLRRRYRDDVVTSVEA